VAHPPDVLELQVRGVVEVDVTGDPAAERLLRGR